MDLRIWFERVFYHLTRPLLILPLITAFGAFLRIYHLGFKSLWADEATLFHIANGSLRHVLVENAAGNSAPPLFALLLSMVIRLSTSEAGLRAISCAAGVAAIPAVYALGRQFMPHLPACFAALLVATAREQIHYSQQAREYSLAFLIAAGLLAAFCLFLRKVSWTNALLLAAVGVLALFTQYGFAVLIVSLNLIFLAYVWRSAERRRALMIWGVVQAFFLLASVGVYVLSLKTHLVTSQEMLWYLSKGLWDQTLRSLVRLSVWNTLEIITFAYPTTLTILLLAAGLLQAIRVERSWVGPLLLVVPMALTLGLAMLNLYPYLADRQTIFLTPMIYVFVALGLTYVTRVQWPVIVAAGVLIFLSWHGLKSSRTYLASTSPEHMRPVVHKLTSAANASDRIYVYYGAAPAFAYYFRNESRPWIRGVRSRERPQAYLEQLEPILRQEGRLFLLFSHIRWRKGQEMDYIIKWASERRSVRLLDANSDVWLYVVE